MAVSKVILNGTTLIDTTDKTVDAGSMLSGITALKNDGTTATGTIQSRTASDLTASGATVTVPAGNYASQATKSVATGTEGTPTATKGAVSNHSVTVTPSVTNTAGYISGGTKTGTAVTVDVSELESGTKSITANGTGISVSGYSAVDVNVSGGGGGASNVVSGSFIALSSEKGTAKEITLDYSGNGYPIIINIFPSEGSYNSGGDLYNTLQRYVIVTSTVTKSYMTGTYAEPHFGGQANYDYALIIGRYKSSATTAYSVATGASNDASIYYNQNANGDSYSEAVRIKSTTKLSVFIANTSYGFKDGIEYSYVVFYSS